MTDRPSCSPYLIGLHFLFFFSFAFSPPRVDNRTKSGPSNTFDGLLVKEMKCKKKERKKNDREEASFEKGTKPLFYVVHSILGEEQKRTVIFLPYVLKFYI